MNALIVYILVENIKNRGSVLHQNLNLADAHAICSLISVTKPDMTCILSCRIPRPRATKINRLSIYMYNPRVDMRPKPQFLYS